MHFRDYFPAALLIVLFCIAMYFTLPIYTKYRQTKSTLQELQRSMEFQEQEIQRLRQEISALRSDYRAIERVAREKFGLCREDEKVYHFDAPAEPTEEKPPE